MLILHPITPANWQTFKTIRLRALQDTPTAFGSTYAKESQLTDADWQSRAAQWTSPRSIAYLAHDADLPVGIAACFLHEDNPAKAHLISMWVAPTHRQQGAGRLLVTAIIDWARSKNAQTLFLMCTSNNTPARKFYERLGFTRTGRTEPYPNDPALIEHEMAFKL
jgi:ribosomal protein S18 acetylase RimI-like enzyme